MSGDNRSVTTDALATLGTIIDETAKRDAIHIAVLPVIAGCKFWPGAHCKVVDGIAWREVAGEGVGIVDPFLIDNIQEGEIFWLLLYPRTIQSLRHVWSHPAFPEETTPEALEKPNKEVSEQWLRDFIDRSDCPDYDTVIAAALQSNDEYLHFEGQDAHGSIPPEFWVHLDIVTGVNIPQAHRASYFSCSC